MKTLFSPRLFGKSLCLAATILALPGFAAEPPKGFTALFNGKDLSGWRGGETFDHRKLLAAPEDQRNAQIAKWTQTMREHWRAENGELVNDGHGAYATTEKDYGDFEFLIDYKTVPKADSGIYLRGVPQVQIWDHTNEREFRNGSNKGSGGLWNNSAGAPGKDPLVLADKPFGEWNKFRIIMVGSRVSIWLAPLTRRASLTPSTVASTAKPSPPCRASPSLPRPAASVCWQRPVSRNSSASATLDLPAPFGPNTKVTSASSNSVAVCDRKFASLSRSIRIAALTPVDSRRPSPGSSP